MSIELNPRKPESINGSKTDAVVNLVSASALTLLTMGDGDALKMSQYRSLAMNDQGKNTEIELVTAGLGMEFSNLFKDVSLISQAHASDKIESEDDDFWNELEDEMEEENADDVALIKKVNEIKDKYGSLDNFNRIYNNNVKRHEATDVVGEYLNSILNGTQNDFDKVKLFKAINYLLDDQTWVNSNASKKVLDFIKNIKTRGMK